MCDFCPLHPLFLHRKSFNRVHANHNDCDGCETWSACFWCKIIFFFLSWKKEWQEQHERLSPRKLRVNVPCIFFIFSSVWYHHFFYITFTFTFIFLNLILFSVAFNFCFSWLIDLRAILRAQTKEISQIFVMFGIKKKFIQASIFHFARLLEWSLPHRVA